MYPSNAVGSSICSKNLREDNTKVDDKPEAPPEIDFVLSHQDAKAASPAYTAVCGEEDPGEGLECLVSTKNDY